MKTVPNRTMYVRYLGKKVCWTVDDGRFYFGECDELTSEELTVCESGGGDMPLTTGIHFAAR